MAELTTVARPYAKAAFQFAEEKGQLAEWSLMLSFTAAVVDDSAVKEILDNPKLTTEQQLNTLTTICADQLDESGKNFIALLASNKRLSALSAISELFEQLKAEKEQSVDVKIISAFEVTSDQTASLATALKTRLGQDVNIESEVDQSLIGGLIIRAGDIVIDGSVRGKLAKLAETMSA
ncbi:MAG: F0F1 ATP synthase subunit delta [Moraxellaceae bacterium]|nr:MAG: F0F1 ATP synthase subunit delta [Moraxellaceae bacterium]